MSKLTPKQELFCLHYAIVRNATQAAIKAGYSEKTAGQIGEQNLKKLEIGKRVKELLGEFSKEAKSDAQKVIAEFERLAFSTSFEEYPELQMRMQDKLKALENLGRIHGIYEADNAQGGVVIYDNPPPPPEEK